MPVQLPVVRPDVAADESAIEWTNYTFNPWHGCAKVSPGCAHCYAETHDARKLLSRELHWGMNTPRRFASDDYMRKPFGWSEKAARDGVRRRVFCASMADLFEFHRDFRIRAKQARYRYKVFQLIIATQHHLDWVLLTKRPENALKYRADLEWVLGHGGQLWLLVSAEDQRRADERIPVLLQCPARVHGVSAEPLLGPLDLSRYLRGSGGRPGLDWVIAGAESGPRARPAELGWFRQLRDQCEAARVPYFLEQAAICPACDGVAPAVCRSCAGTGKSRKLRKGCPSLDGVVWAQIPDTTPC